VYFDRSTHLLTKTESIEDDALFGDVSRETVFLDYRKVGDILIPYRQVDRSGGFTLQDVRLMHVTVNAKPDEGMFVKPSLPELPRGPSGPEIERLSEDAVVVWGGNYNSIAVAFSDHVMVLEAGGNPRHTAAALAQIRRTFPNKPVRYLLVTHWNFDHIAGVRPYVAEGATIITTPMAQLALDHFSSPTRTLRRESEKAAKTAYEIVREARRVFTDGTHTVEIYNVSPNPHVDEMLIAYLPAEKVLFEADLFDLEVPGHEGTGGRATQFLLEWIEKSGLEVRKVVPVHGAAATLDDMRRSLARQRLP
jgi:glyoxylase-like metal-dependent hydrolase (beta-lactamase superfamily II)